MKLMYSCARYAGRACLVLPALAAAQGAAPAADATRYSIVNLAPGSGVALLNQRGQAAFSTYSSGAIINGFFDGRRVHRVGPAGAGDTVVSGLNDRGVVVGQFNDAATPAPFNYRAFSWTVAGGLRAMRGPGTSIARAINERNVAVGSTKGAAFYGRAYRWNPDGTTLDLGPLPASLSEAVAVNDGGMAVGYADVALHDSHAVVWDAGGRATDLGTLGGSQSIAEHVNVRGQVLGTYYLNGLPGGFLWSRNGGIVTIAANAGAGVRPTALNDGGDVAANLVVTDAGGNYVSTPFLWSPARGRRPLALGGAAHGSVDALNNRSGMVGYVVRGSADPLDRRAVRWQGMAAAVDLNARVRAPAGLVLYAGKAINDRGDILADSNAGLVLLRPGAQASDAPVLGPVATGGATAPPAVGASVNFSVAFTDTGPSETHTATASVDDGCPTDAPVVREARGNGEIDICHTFCRAGGVTIKVKVTDRAGNTTEVHRELTVADAATAAATAR
jgi:probable HAF family extracellular repeat protein